MTASTSNPERTPEKNKRELLAELLRQKLRDAVTEHPTTENQRAMWFLHLLAPDSPTFNVAFTARIRSEPDIAALKQAFQTLIERHPTLRTTYIIKDNLPVQRIHGYMDVDFEVIDASPWNAETLNQKVIGYYQRPLDLVHGPLMRISLFRQSAANHVLLITVHHIAADGWSLWLMLDELRELYRAQKSGVAHSLATLEVKYTDFGRWQTEMLAGPEGQKQWDYWQKQLAGDLPVLNLPSDYPRPKLQAKRGASRSFTVDETLTQQIKTLAKSKQTTVYVLLLAAFQTLLYRYTGQEDLVVGSPMAGRTRSELAGIVGCFINTVILRASLSDDVTFSTFLEQVRQTVFDALENQDYPLHLLTERLQIHRDISREPLLQADFVLQKPQQSGDLASILFVSESSDKHWIDFGGLAMEHFYMPQQEGELDLALEMVEGNQMLLGTFKYNSGMFDFSTIGRVIDHFISLFRSIVNNPDQELSKLLILTAYERRQMLVEWNASDADLPKDSCFPELFEAQVLRTPDTIAVAYDGNQLTYDELNRRANQLAHILVEHEVGPGVVVALLDFRGIDLLTAILAVFKAGGAYLPLDPYHPSDRIRQVLLQSKTPLVIFSSELEEKIEQSFHNLPKEERPTLLKFEALWAQQRSEENLSHRSSPQDLAYIIFTSGSTGIPKGAMVEQRGMINHLFAKISALNLSAHDRIAETASQCFDISVWQFLVLLILGGRVHIYADEITHDPASLLKCIEQDEISILETVPSMMRAMLDAVINNKNVPLDLSTLRWFIPTGEALPPDLSRQWFDYFPNIPLLNAYGPAECSDDVTHYPIYEAPPIHVINMPIGRPINNMKMYVLDMHLQPVPIGVPGELFVGGIGVGRGYLNDLQRTNESFLRDPFSRKPHARLYKTGDLVRYLPDGNLEFLGRVDFQVKIRGYRIELGEIETVLSRHPDIAEAVVMARQDYSNDKQLVAYIVASEGHSLSSQEMRVFLQKRLPDYMIPSYFVALDAFPLSPNGKINRKALPAPDRTRPELEHQYAAPRDEIEEGIAEIWAHLLNLKQVGIYDNFFDLGGHSLLATQVISQLRQAFGVDLPLRTLFEFPTAAELSLALLQKKTEQIDNDKLNELLTGLEKLSPDEVETKLKTRD